MYRIGFLFDKKNNWISKYFDKTQFKLSKKYKFSFLYSEQNIKNYDVLFVINYMKIIDQKILNKNKLNLVVHESNLPKGKGFAPVQWQILNNKSLILRISNIIGIPINNKRKIHQTFVDIFFKKIKEGIKYENKKNFKDFLPITKFNEIVFKLIQKNAFGIYNVSLGKKVFLNDIIMWLNFYNKKKTKTTLIKKNFKSDNFTLNNKKLLNIIKIKIDINNLKNECFLISRKFFLKK